MNGKKPLLKAVLIFFAFVFAVFMLVATNVAKIEGVWFISSIVTIRVSTFLTAAACFALVLFLQGRITLKSIYYASLAVIFFLSLFEIVWYYVAAGFNGYDLRIFQFAALFGWVLLGIREVYSKKPPRLSIIFYGVFAVSMLLWIGTGFEFNDLGNSAFSIIGETFNVISKAALAIAYSVHIGSKTP